MTTPAGWFPDPDPSSPPGQLRWWDGEAWTADLRPPAPAPPPAPGAVRPPASAPPTGPPSATGVPPPVGAPPTAPHPVLARSGPPASASPATRTPVDEVDDLALWLFVGLLVLSQLLALAMIGVVEEFVVWAVEEGAAGGLPPTDLTRWTSLSALTSPVSLGLSAGIVWLDERRNPWFAERRAAWARYLAGLFLVPVYVFLRDTNAGRGRVRFWSYLVLSLVLNGGVAAWAVLRTLRVISELDATVIG